MTGPATMDCHEVALTTGSLRVERFGSGPPLVLVHPEDGTLFLQPLIDALSDEREVHVVHLPGWGVTPGADDIDDVVDLALLVAEYAEHTAADPIAVMGVSFGAWVVAEAAVFAPRSCSHVVLVSPLGLKTNGYDERSFVDVYATDPDELRRLLYADHERMPDLATLDDDAFLRLAHATEAVARHGWAPYLHDPKLPKRLARVQAPTLVVTGGADEFVLQPDYARRWIELLGGPARHDELPDVGHRVEEEAPGELARRVLEFLGTD